MKRSSLRGSRIRRRMLRLWRMIYLPFALQVVQAEFSKPPWYPTQTYSPPLTECKNRTFPILTSLTYIRVPQLTAKDTHISYLPLSHIYERLVIWGLFFLGGRIGFYNGNISKIKDDFEVLKPTFLTSVPRLYNKFAEVIKTKIQNVTGITGSLTNKAVAYKLRKLKENG